MIALAAEIHAETGAESLDLLHAKQTERTARSAYAQAVDHERAALRAAEQRGAVADCPRCLRCEVAGMVVETILCGHHAAQLHAIRQATARRITAQRTLAAANYALERIRKAQR